MNLLYILITVTALISMDPGSIAELEKRVKANPDDWQAALKLTEIFLDQQNYDEARRYLLAAETALDSSSNNTCEADFEYLYGLYWDLTDNIFKAYECYSRAVACDSCYSPAWRNLGYMHEIFGNYDQMLFCLKKALPGTGDSAGAYYDIAVAYDYLDSLDRAMDYYYRAYEMNDGDPQIMMNLGIDWGLQGHVDSALCYFEKADQAGLKTPELYYNLGVVMSEGGAVEAAMNNFMKALAIDPDYFIARYQLANMYELLGDSGMAKVYYEDFIEVAPLIYLDNINEVKEKLARYYRAR